MAIIFGFQLLVPQPERAPVSEDQTNEQSLVDLSLQGSSSGTLIAVSYTHLTLPTTD